MSQKYLKTEFGQQYVAVYNFKMLLSNDFVKTNREMY